MITLPALARRLQRDERAVAFMEFALSLPLLLTLVFTGLETANFAIANLRVSQAAMMVADNAARVRDRIDEVDVNDIFTGVRLANSGIDLTNYGRVTLSTVEDNTATTATDDQVVTWQRCKGVYAGSPTSYSEGQVITAGLGTGTNKISPTASNPVVFADVAYVYQPLIPALAAPLFGPNRVIRYTSAFSVRDRVYQPMQNGTNLPATSKSTCNYFTSS